MALNDIKYALDDKMCLKDGWLVYWSRKI